MIKLYFILLYRRVAEKLSLFLLNFIGYVILLSVISLTSLFIYGELSYDNFKKKDRIYRMVNSITAGSKPAFGIYYSKNCCQIKKLEKEDIKQNT